MFFRKKKKKEVDFESKFIPNEWLYAYPTPPTILFRKELEEEMKKSKE